jgi:cobalt/nickel transport protein
VFKKLFHSLALAIVLLSSSLFTTSAFAHFQMVYTPDLLRDRGGLINLKMPFTHPADNGHVMTVDTPEQFYMIKKGKKNRPAR